MKDDINLKPKLNPLVSSLSPYLKDPKNYLKIKKFILKELQGKCSHGEVVEWAKCELCQQRFAKKRSLLKSLGFKNAAQYMAWQQIHEEIKKRFPLMNWQEENAKRKQII